MNNSQSSKALIVGFDGATFDVIHPLVEAGRLPNLVRLMREGAWGTLHSTVPPISPSAWTTFATGKNPGRHGVFDFRRLSETYAWQARTTQIRHQTLWRLLSEADRRVIAVDVPFTYPPEPVNGMMITGYPTPRTPETVFTHPADLPARLAEAGFDLNLGWPEDRIDVHPDFFRAWESVMDERERLLIHLIENEPWDLFMVVFGITDTLAHTLWHYLDPAHPAYHDAQADRYREALFHGYELADRGLGALWSRIDPSTHLIVLSDHGFGTIRPRQWLFRFLEERGWLRYPQPSGIGAILAPLRKQALKLYTEVGWLRRLIREMRPNTKGAMKAALAKGGMLAETSGLDAPHSPVIPSDMGTHLYLNRTERFADGFLSPAEADALAEEIRDALLAARDPVDGQPVVRAVHRRDEVYTGAEVDHAPDLIVTYANRYEPGKTSALLNPRLTGGHAPEGILLAWGPAVRPGSAPATSIVHVAPTVLSLMDEPVPPDMDGARLDRWLDSAWVSVNPVRTADRSAVRDDTETDLSGDEQDAVEAQLRALGYIE